ncbi:DinB family protein [Pedobacter sp. ISL-68]|uniref:DinB family protein n=1 Tax=unclassified Pedobacter TaxID=2628915 RepID=UPI001BE79417|nr:MULTISPECIES: DinB family protein [unclassified Pedobacter]MBT2560078.1 DinB family protein [Pedobacter sp. ISL-64]MBT2589057.1 DinB family protein [Pedobacter sp. ISL-68]
MEQYLAALTANRASLNERTRSLTGAQLNWVPPGHQNNIIWNMGHMLVVSENILYKLSPHSRPVHPFEIAQFGRNIKPEHIVLEQEISQISQALLKTARTFKGAPEATVSKERLQFLLFHESLHHQTIDKIIQQLTI